MVVASVLGFLGEHPGILVVLFLLYCFIYALSLLFAGPKPGRNPFGVRFLRPPPEKIVTEQKVRNTILKQSMHLYHYGPLRSLSCVTVNSITCQWVICVLHKPQLPAISPSGASSQSACPYRIDIGNWSEYRHIGPITARRLSDIKT